ncbi:MAG TPA: metallophosphoesterase [Gemmatimonadaceae bacterium]|nr:metallophosphoesterase [Gemmatimonadaceae bacterium]
MTHAFVCIGDIHLKHGHQWNADRLAALDQILREGAAREDLAAWLVLGDVFDTRSSIEDRNAIAPRLQQMGERAPVVIVAGNHDMPGDLDVLGKLKARYPILVVTRAQTLSIDTPTGARAAIFAVPYPHKHALVGAGVAHAQLGDVAGHLLDAMFLEGADQLTRAARAGELTLMIGHATIAGSVSSVGQPMGLDHSIAITQGHLERLGDVPEIFGHIHAPQEICGAYYAGSITAHDFGEVDRKRYLVVEYAADGYRVLSMPLDTPPLYHVEGTFARETGFTWTVTRGPDGEALGPPPTWRGVRVRVRYRFLEAEASALDTAHILAAFAEARSLALEPIAIRERAHRAPEVVAAQTLPEKVAAFVRSSGVPWTPALAGKLAALQEPDTTGFLARAQHAWSGAPTDTPSVAGSSSPEAQAAPDSDLFEEVHA